MKRESSSLLRSLDPASHQFARRDEAPLVRDGASAPCYLATALVCLSAPLGVAWKMLLADFCNRLLVTSTPRDRWIPEPRGLRRADQPLQGENEQARLRSSRRPAPNRLAATRPRMSMRLTARAQLRSVRRALSAPCYVSSRAARDDPSFWVAIFVTVYSTANETDVANL